jgi:predicted MFS family arabinose efflux permease
MICVCNVSYGMYANYTYTAKYLEIHTSTCECIILIHGVILVNGNSLGGVQANRGQIHSP